VSTALGPVEVALAAAIKADTVLRTLLTGYMVYARRRPETITVAGKNVPTPFDYLTIGARAENGANVFSRRGNVGTYQIHIWTRKDKLTEIYAALEALLNGKRLTLSAGNMVNGSLTYITDGVDSDNQTLHGICAYRVLSQAALS
jgi:hypothetical protein